MVVIYPELKRAERYPISHDRSGQWSSALALLEAGFPRDRHDLDSKFRVMREVQTNDLVSVRLEPKAASARRMIPHIDLTFSTNDFSLRATELEFPDGSTLRNDFEHPQLNPKVDENLFEPKIPADYKIVEPMRK